MFVLDRQEIKLISPINLITMTVSAQIIDNVNCIYFIQLIHTVMLKVICE